MSNDFLLKKGIIDKRETMSLLSTESEFKNLYKSDDYFNIKNLKELKIDDINNLKNRNTMITKILKNEDKFFDKKCYDSIVLLKALYCK